jgi:hypothetical protein
MIGRQIGKRGGERIVSSGLNPSGLAGFRVWLALDSAGRLRGRLGGSK